MQARSERAAAAVANPGDAQVISRVEILLDGEVVATAQTAGGQVDVDATADVARMCRLDLVVESSPAQLRSLLVPGVSEVACYRGFQWPDGSTELAQLGVFGVNRAPITASPGGASVRVVGYDRARAYQRAGTVSASRLRPGTTLETAVGNLLRDRVAQIPQALPATGATLNGWTLVDVGDDPWLAAREVCEAFGWDLYLDVTGTLRMRSLNAVGDPVASYGPGLTAAVLEAEVEPTDEDVYSGVVVVGTGPDNTTPVRGEAWDLDPDSPTYSLGPFGPVPLVIRSEQVNTNAQATTSAEAKLPDVTGVSEPLTWSQLVDPWLDARDVIRHRRPELGVDRDYRLEALTVPLEPSRPMSGRGKAVRRWT